MNTTVSRRKQTSVPAAICNRYNIHEGTRLEWIDTGFGIQVVPIMGDPVAHLTGIAKGEGLRVQLLKDRKKDKLRD
jgi:bifunctional DNA-binding transcriptional regulator/antitoxin component of YhaV-PrlF toxin-antitoxin module